MMHSSSLAAASRPQSSGSVSSSTSEADSPATHKRQGTLATGLLSRIPFVRGASEHISRRPTSRGTDRDSPTGGDPDAPSATFSTSQKQPPPLLHPLPRPIQSSSLHNNILRPQSPSDTQPQRQPQPYFSQEYSPPAPSSQIPPSKTRRRRGSLRKVALLGRGAQRERREAMAAQSGSNPGPFLRQHEPEQQEEPERGLVSRQDRFTAGGGLGISDFDTAASPPTAVRRVSGGRTSSSSTTASATTTMTTSSSSSSSSGGGGGGKSSMSGLFLRRESLYSNNEQYTNHGRSVSPTTPTMTTTVRTLLKRRSTATTDASGTSSLTTDSTTDEDEYGGDGDGDGDGLHMQQHGGLLSATVSASASLLRSTQGESVSASTSISISVAASSSGSDTYGHGGGSDRGSSTGGRFQLPAPLQRSVEGGSDSGSNLSSLQDKLGLDGLRGGASASTTAATGRSQSTSSLLLQQHQQQHQQKHQQKQLKQRAKSPLALTDLASPLPASVSTADPGWDYDETEWWGWVMLAVTWLVFVTGMGSCLGVWSWAWDVGKTPYAPPELEDDPTLPIVGYYPALLILTSVMAWVWVVVAWIGMKYFRHAKISGD